MAASFPVLKSIVSPPVLPHPKLARCARCSACVRFGENAPAYHFPEDEGGETFPQLVPRGPFEDASKTRFLMPLDMVRAALKN
jgi:hypothetical protein